MEAGRRTMKSHFKVNNGTLSRCQFNRTKKDMSAIKHIH